jgi:RNA polymerase sigma factor (sigma-70 family)
MNGFPAIMLDTADERNALLFAILSQYGELIMRQAKIVDDAQGIALKLLTSSPDLLLPEFGQDATAWLTAVLFNMTRDRYRAENRHERIVREHAPELADIYHSGVGESAESIVMRKLAEEDMRERILRLPPKLAQVAALRYAGYSFGEIAQLLGISESASWKRAQSIRSARIRRALGLG